MASIDFSFILKTLPVVVQLIHDTGLIKTTTGGHDVAQLALDAASIAAGGQDSAQTIAGIQQLLKDAQGQGILAGSVMDAALKTAAVASNLVSGQLAVLDSNLHVLGVEADVFAIAKNTTVPELMAFRQAVGLA